MSAGPSRKLPTYIAVALAYMIVWAVALIFFVTIRPRMPLLISGGAWWLVISLAWGVAALWKTHRKKLLLAGISTGIACLLGEIVLRLMAPEASLPAYRGRPSIEYHHALPPNQRMFIGYVGPDPVVVSTNEDGLRTTYSREAFKAHKHRIMLLGDSFIFGLNVRQDLILASRLEAILRERLETEDVAVITAGISSYSPFLEKLAYEGFLREYKPTITLVYLDPTDIADDEAYMSEWRTKTEAKPQGRFFDRGSGRVWYLGAFNERVLKPYVWRPLLLPVDLAFTSEREKYDWYQFRVTMADGTEADRWFIYKHPLEETRKYFDQTFSNIAEIARMAQSIGSRFTLFVTPRFHHWSNRECPDNLERGGYGDDEPYEFAMFEYAESVKDTAGFPIRNLLPDFQATDRFPLVFPADPHWNAEGNQFVAEITADYLIGAKYLP